MSKGYNLKNSASDQKKKEESKGTKNNLDESCEFCIKCKSQNVRYWDETDEEIIFQCNACKSFISIPFSRHKLKFYFA